MHKQLQRLAIFTALAIGATAFSITPALAISMAQDQEHRVQNQHPDYSNNKYYQLGNKEGLEDHQKNKQRTTHNHNYKTDVDKQAHDYGYQQGWQGQSYHSEHRTPN
jgi:hypothetical protein